jgi:hypothetical protein
MDPSQFFTFDLIAAAMVSSFFLAFAPNIFAFFVDVKPNKLPSTVRELIARYTYGTASLLAGFAVLPDSERTMARILFITVIGGSVVVLRYISDRWQRLEQHDRMAAGNDKDLNNG